MNLSSYYTGEHKGTGRHWSPFLLQRYVFYVFISIFCGLVIALETSLFISDWNKGLATTTENTRYIWTYGPAAVFGLLAAIWTCTEYTAKAASPWIQYRISRRNANRQTPLTLDYISMFSIFVPFRAFLNQDYVVAAGALISQLLTILIIVTPSLFKIISVDLDKTAIATSRFTNNSPNLTEVGLISIYAGIGIHRYKLPYPDGISDQLVYQTTAQSAQSISSLQATVTGLSIDIDCHEATLHSFDIGPVPPPHLAYNFYPLSMNLSTTDCYITVSNHTIDLFLVLPRTFGRLFSGSCIDTSSAQSSHERLIFFFAEVEIATDDSVKGKARSHFHLVRSTQILCAPSYSINNYEISQTMGNAPQLMLAQDPNMRKLDHLQTWDFAQAMLDAYPARYPSSTDVLGMILTRDLNSIGWEVDLDSCSIAILGFSNNSFSEPSSIFNSSLVSSALRSYYHLHAAFLAKSALIEPAFSEIPGEMRIRADRLIMQSLACHSMAAICLLAALILGATIRFFPRRISLTGDPGTILGVAELTKKTAHCFPRDLSLKDAKTADRIAEDRSLWRETGVLRENKVDEGDVTFIRRLHQDRRLPRSPTKQPHKLYQPFILKATSRSLICFTLAATIFALEYLLNYSTEKQGIGEVSTFAYAHYLWTALPAIVLSSIGLVISSVDTECRIIAPYHALNCGPTSVSVSLNQKLLGTLAPHTLYMQLRASNYGGLMATGAAIAASFLSITAGSLFFESSTFTTTAELQLIGSFSSNTWDPNWLFHHFTSDFAGSGGSGEITFEFDFGITSTLILANNLSYPAFTFEGLALPELSWANNQSSDWLNTSNLIVQAVVPALESGFNCYQYNESEIAAEIVFVDPDKEPKLGPTEWPAGFRVLVNVTGQYCRNDLYNGTASDLSVTAAFLINETMSSGGVFATSTTSYHTDIIFQPCTSQFLYIWGGFSDGLPSTVSASAAICNASISAVDIEIEFSGSELTISESHPPRRTRSLAREAALVNDIRDQNPAIPYRVVKDEIALYRDLYSWSVRDSSVLDAFFSLLTTSRYAIPSSALADRAQNAQVVDAIIFHSNVMVAQLLSTFSRIGGADQSHLPEKDLGVFARTGQGNINDTVSATLIGNPNNLPGRVMQSKTATRITQALLGTTFIMSIMSWYFGPRRGILPRSPTSAASVLAMLVDGNLFNFCEQRLGEGDPMRFPEMAEAVGDMRLFRLGPGVGGGHARRFGIFAVDGSGLLNASTLKMRSPESHAGSQST